MIHSTQAATGALIVRPGVERLTAINAKPFKDEVISLIESGNSELIIDFAKTTFLDSSGLGALTGILKKIGHRGELVVCGLGPDVLQMFKICRMDRVFAIYQDETSAVQALSERA